MPANLEIAFQQWPQKWKRPVYIPIPKQDNAKEYSNYCTTALISHASKVMLIILQARLQQYVNRELPDVQAGFRKSRGTRDQIANIHWIIEISREFQKSIYFCFTLTTLFLLCFTFSTLTTLKALAMWITTMENSSRDGNTRPPYLPPEKPACRSRSNSYNWIWNNRLVQNWERNTSRPYIITLFI